MKIDVAKNIISHFDKTTFRSFILKLLYKEYNESHTGYTISEIENSDLIENTYINSPTYYQHFFIFDYLPYNIFKDYKRIKVDTLTVTVKKQLEEIQQKRLRGFMLGDVYFLNNTFGFSIEDCQSYILPQIKALSENIIDPDQTYGFGNIDTIFTGSEMYALSCLENQIQEFSGVTITITDNGYTVNEFHNQNYINTGVLKSDFSLLNSIIVVQNKRNILSEFEKILNGSYKESVIEQFIVENYQEIFGEKYNSIIPQVMIRFPELDINNKNRRLDILLKNNISNDWEIFELKKVGSITKQYRGMPAFKSEVHDAIQQLKNYSNLLKQEQVKRKLKKELGIEYFVPEIHLVIGRESNNLNKNQWRQLITSVSNDVNIITYDTLLKEMSNRVNVFENLFTI